MVNNAARRLIYFFVISFLLIQCTSVNFSAVTPTSESLHQQIGTRPVTSQSGCVFPPVPVSDGGIQRFGWREDSEAIIYQEKSGQIWYSYNIVSNQLNRIDMESSPTSTADIHSFNINDYVDIFISPSRETILFTRGTPAKLAVYYKFADDEQEYQLGTIHGSIKEVDWFNNEKNAIIAMDWQAAVYPEASIYTVDFSKNELLIEINKENDYKNVEYLGLTPDGTHFMFVSYLNIVHLDRTVKIWNLSTHAITSTPVYNPLDFQWVSESEFIGISQNPDLFSVVSVVLYDIDNSKLTYLAEKKFSVDPLISNAIQISPNGSSIAYIENETGRLYWVTCRY